MKSINFRAVLMISALALSVGAQAADEKTKPTTKPSESKPMDTMAPDQNAKEQTGATELSSADRTFVTDAMQAGESEVKMGKLAEQNGSSAEVKRLGRRLVDDHQKANTQLEKLAKKYNVTMKEADRSASSELQELTNLKGADFDRSFLRTAVSQHEKAIEKFQKEVRDGENAEVKQFAAKNIATLEEHLRIATDLRNQKPQGRTPPKTEHQTPTHQPPPSESPEMMK
jgi:putative membrane protein